MFRVCSTTTKSGVPIGEVDSEGAKGLEEEIKKIYKYAETCINRYGVYHDHKETMAYNIFLVEAGLFSYVMLQELPIWGEIPNFPKGVIYFVAVLVIWLFFHCLLCFQLEKRRNASILIGGYIRAIRKLRTEREIASEKFLAMEEDLTCSISDVGLVGEPQLTFECIKTQAERTIVKLPERVLTWCSIILMIFSTIRLSVSEKSFNWQLTMFALIIVPLCHIGICFFWKNAGRK